MRSPSSPSPLPPASQTRTRAVPRLYPWVPASGLPLDATWSPSYSHRESHGQEGGVETRDKEYERPGTLLLLRACEPTSYAPIHYMLCTPARPLQLGRANRYRCWDLVNLVPPQAAGRRAWYLP